MAAMGELFRVDVIRFGSESWCRTLTMFSGNRPAPRHAERMFFSLIAQDLA